MRRATRTLVVVVVLALAACAGVDNSGDTTTTSGSSTDPTATSAAARGDIQDVDFANATLDYPSAASENQRVEEVTLADGRFDSDDETAPMSFRLTDVDYADLDGDGEDEAALTIAYDTGGTGRFTDVLIYRWDGGARYVTHDGIGDRADDGVARVSVDPAIVDRPARLEVRRFTNDGSGACCPAGIESSLRRLDNGRLRNDETERWPITWVGTGADGAPASGPTLIRFLPDSDRVQLMGAASPAVTATFEAGAGDVLVVSVEGDELVERPVLVIVTGSAGEVARIGSGAELEASATLPADGTYTVEVQAVGAVADGDTRDFSVDLELRR